MTSRFTILSRGLVRKRGEMNGTEKAYAAELDVLKAAGEIADYWHEPFSLRISECDEGQPARYTPDFLILMPDGRTYLDDVKQGKKEYDDKAAVVRIKVAASQYPLWIFRTVRKQLKRDGGGFLVTEI